MNANEELRKLLDRLATQRDELIVQAHLGRLQAHDDWERLEKQLEQMRGKAAAAATVTGDTAREVLAAARLAGEEIARGYERLRKAL
jgi:predicted anti-sigma-YlaC factor YlaD